MIPLGLMRTLCAMGGLIFVGSLLATSCLTPDFNFGDAGNFAGASGLDSCDNGRRDGSETDVDCGGSCPPCSIGDGCNRARDCESSPDGDPAVTQCVNGSCSLLCPTSRADCNLSASDGCEVNILASVDHCGACRQSCSPPNATGQCQMGNCTILRCSDGFADVNGEVEDGCEIDTNTDPNHCGPSRIECSNAGGTPRCEDGVCTIACDSGFADCNENATDGCEINLGRDARNCSECGNVCPAQAGETAFCMNGSCGATVCEPGLGDCDGDGECEADLTTLDDCGGCGNACTAPNGTPACNAGACAVASCNEGFDDCTDDPGCETPTTSDPNHCGGCGQACSTNNAASVSCTEGSCVPGCNDDWCPGTNPRTQGCNIRLGTPNACASCGDVCSGSTPFCVAASGGGNQCQGHIPVVVRNSNTSNRREINSSSESPQLTLQHNLSRGAGNHRAVLVGVTAVWNNSNHQVSVTYAGVTMSRAVTRQRPDGGEASIFYLLDSALPSSTGTYNVAVSGGSGWHWGSVIANVVELSNAEQAAPSAGATNTTLHTGPPACATTTHPASVANPQSLVYVTAIAWSESASPGTANAVGLFETHSAYQQSQNHGKFGYRLQPTPASPTVGWTSIDPCFASALVTATFSSVVTP